MAGRLLRRVRDVAAVAGYRQAVKVAQVQHDSAADDRMARRLELVERRLTEVEERANLAERRYRVATRYIADLLRWFDRPDSPKPAPPALIADDL